MIINKLTAFRILVVAFFVNTSANAQILTQADALIYAGGGPHYGGGFAVDLNGNSFGSLITDSYVDFQDGTSIASPDGTKAFKIDSLGNVVYAYAAGTSSGANDGSFLEFKVGNGGDLYASGWGDIFPANININNLFWPGYFISRLSENGEMLTVTRFPERPYFEVQDNGNVAFAFGYENAGYLGAEYLTLGSPRIVFGELDTLGNVLWREVSPSSFTVPNALSLVQGCGHRGNKFLIHGAFHNTGNLWGTSVVLDNYTNVYVNKDVYIIQVDLPSHQVDTVLSTSNLYIKDIKFDDQGGIYFGIQHYRDYQAADGLIFGQTIPLPSKEDAYVLKTSSNFQFEYMHDLCGLSLPTSAKLFLSQIEYHNGDVYALGRFDFNGTAMSLYPGGTIYSGVNRKFLVRLNDTLNIEGGHILDPTGSVGHNILYMDGRGDYIYVFADVPSATTSSTFNHNFCIGKYRTNGNFIRGRAFKDFNENGTFDSGDAPIDGSVVILEPSTLLAITDPDGYYKFQVDQGTYVVKLPDAPLYYSNSPDSVIIQFNAWDQESIQDLTLTDVPGGHDLSVDFVSMTPVLPGFDAEQKIIITNEGTFIESGYVQLDALDYSLSPLILTSSPTLTYLAPYHTYNFTNLAPGQSITIDLSYDIPLSFLSILGEKDTTVVSVFMNTNVDADLTNNINQIFATVVASFDPNVKETNRNTEIQLSELDDFEYMNYTVHFQNEGNYHATNIRIEDEISDNLILESFQLVDQSDNVYVEIEDRKAIFYFENIMLPSITVSEHDSKGYVQFKIKKKVSLVIGDSIVNTAYIYFDYNPAIVTNQTVNTVVENSIIIDPIGIDESYLENLVKVYPNVSSDDYNVEFIKPCTGSVELISSNGEILITEKVGLVKELTIDASMLPSNVYFIRVNTDTIRAIVKVVKM